MGVNLTFKFSVFITIISDWNKLPDLCDYVSQGVWAMNEIG